MSHAHFLHAMLLVLAVPLAAVAGQRPNILFVYTDDQAPTAVGIHNQQLRTPHMDRLFREGARLANSFVTTPVCSPARAGVMTSRYGSELGITDWINPRSESALGLDPKTVTWPELLAKSGYKNGLVGKWHLGTADRFHPTRTGFDYFMGFRGGGTRPKNPTLELDGRTKVFEGFTADILTDHALEYIRESRDGPFLLCLHFRAPHAAWLPVREEDYAPYKDLDPQIPNAGFPNLDVRKIKRMTREYYASVASVDRNLGRVLALLDELKLAANTVVIFTSDHGYNLGHHALWYKGNAQWQLTQLPEQKWPHIGRKQRPNLFEQSLRVATAVRWPGVIQAGTVVTHTISNLDWYPTLLAIADVAPAEGVIVRGRNFLPILRGERIDWDNDLYAEYSMKHGAQTHMRAWRTPNWKLMIDFKNAGRAELYDLRRDSTETTNLIDSKDPEIQHVKRRLTNRILQKMRELGDPADVGGVKAD
ncbi:MAG: hypothetical protein CMJ48_11160 [Planctomycetaceae bacterium]|nr:hypothetical protein [Planctomycetaceae bacterium]